MTVRDDWGLLLELPPIIVDFAINFRPGTVSEVTGAFLLRDLVMVERLQFCRAGGRNRKDLRPLET